MSVIEEFIKVKKTIEQPKKDSTNPQFKSGYVSLDGVIASIDKAIKDSGANFVWWQEIVDGIVNTVLSDGSGEPITIPGFPLIAVDRNKSVSISQASPQALGSGLTYAKRYSLTTAFGISSDIDDDGEQAQKQTRQSNRSQQPKQQEKIPFSGLSDKELIDKYLSQNPENKSNVDEYLKTKSEHEVAEMMKNYIDWSK